MILVVILRLLSGELEDVVIPLPLATNQLQCIAGAQSVLAEKMQLYPGATVERIGCKRRQS
jgi:hypothetical protein